MQLSTCDLKDQRGSCVLCLSILNWPWILRHWFFIFYQGQALSPFWPQPAVWASGPRSPMRMSHICWFFFTADSVQVTALAGSRRPQATHSGVLGTFRGWASCVQNDNDPPCLQTLALTLVQTPARGSGQTHVLQPCPQHFVHPQRSQPLYHPWQGKRAQEILLGWWKCSQTDWWCRLHNWVNSRKIMELCNWNGWILSCIKYTAVKL